MSCGWDKYVKVWNLTNCKLKTNHIGHTGYLNTVTLSPDGSLCASGGKDGKAMLWDLNDGKHLYTLENTDIISSLVFSPNRYKDIALHSEGIRGLMIAWVTVGHLGVTVGHFRATAGHLRVIKGPLRVRN